MLAAGDEGEGGISGGGGEGEDEYDLLMVVSEAMKEEAKGRFQRGDYMGAAKAYRKAAAALDERAPPTAARLEPLRRRLRSLYLTCMCNAAVAGFKASAASPAPGEAHNLVVDACSKALARSGGTCPKARFWRARVKISQRMYEAAEIDLRKAVEEEEREAEEERKKENAGGRKEGEAQEGGQKEGGTADSEEGRQRQEDQQKQRQKSQERQDKVSGSDGSGSGSGGGEVVANGAASDGGKTPGLRNDTSLSPSGASFSPSVDPSCSSGVSAGSFSTSSPTSEDAAAATARATNGPSNDSNGKDHHAETPPGDGTPGGGHDGNAIDKGDFPSARRGHGEGRDGGGGGGGYGRDGGESRGGSEAKKASEAVRWLARVRAKIAQMDADRALAAEQASAREEKAVKGRQRTTELAQRRARYGPGHVPRRASPSPAADDGEAGVDNEDTDSSAGGAAIAPAADRSGGGSGAIDWQQRGRGGAQVDVVVGWKVPRPPPLKVPARSPAMVMNDYSMQAKFQPAIEYEQVTGEEGQVEYICTIKVGPGDRIVGDGRGSNMKASKQQASRELLVNAALAWNEENPEDLIDMDMMVPLPNSVASRKPAAPPTEITEEFKRYCAAWVDKVVSEDIHEAVFPTDIEKHQRKYVHRVVEELENPAVLSKSATVGGTRRLSVMRRAMMEGMAFMSGDSVVVVDLPASPACPSDVEDLASITRPPPERKAAKAATDENGGAAAVEAVGKGKTSAAAKAGAAGKKMDSSGAEELESGRKAEGAAERADPAAAEGSEGCGNIVERAEAIKTAA
ncbi:unnamed protein product [Scytosiphon promiscuus]